MGGDYSAVAVIGAALVVAIGLFATCGERWNRRRVQPEPQPAERTDCDRAWNQQQHRKDAEL